MFYFRFQLRVLAKDGGTPSRTATTIVTIDVDRNLNSPRFSPNNLRVNIPETLTAGSLVTSVTASDEDTQASYYSWNSYFFVTVSTRYFLPFGEN